MKLLWGFVLLFVAACASKSVKLTPSEVESLMEEKKDFLQSMQSEQEADKRFRHYYYKCDSRESECSRTDCYGLDPKTMNCWKAPVSREEVLQKSGQDKSDQVHLDPEQQQKVKALCQDKGQLLEVRRNACRDHIANGGAGSKSSELLSIVKTFCDWQGVQCRKNGQRFGKGSIDSISHRRLQQLTLRMQTENQKSDFYEISALD